jgi:hypothetical protein
LDTDDTAALGIDMWHTKAHPHHGIPSVRTSDGPNGVRGTKFFNGIKAACFPCGTGLGATFNLELLEEAGKLMGAEARAKGVHAIVSNFEIQLLPICRFILFWGGSRCWLLGTWGVDILKQVKNSLSSIP